MSEEFCFAAFFFSRGHTALIHLCFVRVLFSFVNFVASCVCVCLLALSLLFKTKKAAKQNPSDV
jgi:hypothetical protein